MTFIQSRQNAKIKEIVKLHERRHRDERQCFIVEGLRELSRAISNHVVIEEIYYCEDKFKDAESNHIIRQAISNKIPCYSVSADAFEKISHREGPDGLLGIAKHWELDISQLKLSEKPFLLVVEKIEKPGNLGNLIRSADSAGVDGMIICDPVVDLFNPNVIRACQGAMFSLPIVITDNQATIDFLHKSNIQPIATTPHTETIYWDAPLNQSVAILLGSEKDGLSNFWLLHSSIHVKIPQKGLSDSLNVNSAATLVLYEALRQRR